MPTAAPVIGTKIGEFVIRRMLAEGGMGVCYVAEHVRFPDLKKVFKILLPQYAQKADVRARFEREAEAAARLKHEAICEVDDFGVLENGELWLKMPFLPGRPLDEFLTLQGRFDPYHALTFMVQLCSALDHAHRAGVIHRDLKPANIFVCATDPLKIKLLDFGIAKILTRFDAVVTSAGTTIGTPLYMSVEQYEHADMATSRSDIYSAALILHQIVTGTLPWGWVENTAVLYLKKKTELPNLNGLSPPWRKAVAKALAEPTPGGLECVRRLAPELLRDSRPLAAARIRLRPDGVTLRGKKPAPSRRDEVTLRVRPRTLTETTLGHAAATVSLPNPPPVAPPRWKLAIIGTLACLLGAVTTFSLVRSTNSEVAAASSPLPPPPPPPPIDAGTDAALDATR